MVVSRWGDDHQRALGKVVSEEGVGEGVDDRLVFRRWACELLFGSESCSHLPFEQAGT